MASKICSLHVINKKGKTRAIGRSVIGPNKGGLVHFYELDHVRAALQLEEDNEIEIKDKVPTHIMDQIESAKEAEENRPPSPVAQARENFNGKNTAPKNQEGWNSPDDAYKGEDLKDREGGFATITPSTEQTDKELAEEENKEEGVAPEHAPPKNDEGWNSPDDAYAGEDMKDREHNEGEENNAGEEAAEQEQKEAQGPQDQTSDTDAGISPASETGDKPSYYLNYDEVEGKTKAELIEWAEKEVPATEGLTLGKNNTAKDIKAEVHKFLKGKYPDHSQ